MLNSYLKLYPDGCQVRFYHYKNNVPVIHTDSDLPSDQAHSNYTSLARTKKMVHDYARSNDFSYFVTLTFNPVYVDSFSVDDSYEHMRNWLNYMRKKFPDLRYLGVPELHKSGRIHFHFLMSEHINSVLSDSGKKTDKKSGSLPIYNVGSYRIGFSTATEIKSQAFVVRYILKYITKELQQRCPHKRRYWHSNNLVLPKTFATHLEFDQFAAMLEKLEVTYSSHKESDYSYCDFFEVSLDSCGELFPFLENFRENISAYDGIPEGFFPVGSTDVPFD